MKIGITGATGFIGSNVATAARAQQHEVIAFSRSPEKPLSGFAETRRFTLDAPPDLTGLDAIVHLAGESILGVWTPAKKRRILTSRVEGTRRIVEALGQPGAPRTFLCASAIGYYGNTLDNPVTEASPSGTGFLADVCRAWETESQKSPPTVRLINLRIGFVIGPGGAMRLIKPLFRAGLGGRLGSGRQWMSCIHVDDIAGLALHALTHESLSGPLNAVMPEPIRNRDFTRAVADSVHRPAILPAPAIALKIALGEFSHLLLDSQRVLPEATLTSGFIHQYATLPQALTHSENSPAGKNSEIGSVSR